MNHSCAWPDVQRSSAEGCGPSLADQRAVVREDVEECAHGFERRLEAPHGIESGCQLERDSDAAHENELVRRVREIGGKAERKRSAEAVANHRYTPQAEGIQEPDQMLGPGGLAAVRDQMMPASSRIRDGGRYCSVTRPPTAESASSMALVIAAGAPIIPPSPTPL